MADKNIQKDIATYLNTLKKSSASVIMEYAPRYRVPKELLDTLSTQKDAFTKVAQTLKDKMAAHDLFKLTLENERSELILSILTASGSVAESRDRVGRMANMLSMNGSDINSVIPERVVKVGDEGVK